MLRITVAGVLGLVFVAAATWLANYVTELMFSPENSDTRAKTRWPAAGGTP
jgi:hypothetical protein